MRFTAVVLLTAVDFALVGCAPRTPDVGRNGTVSAGASAAASRDAAVAVRLRLYSRPALQSMFRLDIEDPLTAMQLREGDRKIVEGGVASANLTVTCRLRQQDMYSLTSHSYVALQAPIRSRMPDGG